MNLTTPSAPETDPFVRGLARRLGQRAESTDVPPLPMTTIHAQIAHRRQRRRLRAAIGAAVAVTVAVLTTVAVVGDRDRDAVTAGPGSAATMPLFGFANDTWIVVRQNPGTQYAVVDGTGADAVALIVTRDGADLGVSRVVRSVDRTIENMRGNLQVGTVSIGDASAPPRTAVWWAVAPGFTATVTGNAAGAYDDPTELLAATVELVDVDETTWRERGGNTDDVRLDARAPSEPSPLW